MNEERLLTLMGGLDGHSNLSLDFTAMADGQAINLTGDTWAVSSSKLINTPTGTRKDINGGFETWGGGNPSSWGRETAGTSTWNQETTIVKEGSSSLRFDIDASNSKPTMYQASGASAGEFLSISTWNYASAADKVMALGVNAANYIRLNPGSTWTNSKAIVYNPEASNIWLRAFGDVASSSLYWDDVQFSVLDSSIIALAKFKKSLMTVKATATITTGDICGVVTNADKLSSPTSYVLAYIYWNNYDNSKKAFLVKYVNGAPTVLISGTAISYVDGGLLEIRHPSSTTYQLFYGGIQVGTDKTVSDSEITGNRFHGLMSAGGSSSFDAFFCL